MQNQAKQRSKVTTDSSVPEVQQGLGYEHSYTSLASSKVHGFVIHKADICFWVQAKSEAQLLTSSLDFPQVHQVLSTPWSEYLCPVRPKILVLRSSPSWVMGSVAALLGDD